MHLKLRDQQLKTIMYICKWLHQNLMVTTKKSIIHIYTEKGKKNQNTKLKTVIKSQEN